MDTCGAGPAIGTGWKRNSMARVTLGADQQSTHPSEARQFRRHFLLLSSLFQRHLPSRVAILAFLSSEQRMSWLVLVSGKKMERSRFEPCQRKIIYEFFARRSKRGSN